MTLPLTGPISLNQLRDEYGQTGQASLLDYYADGGIVPPGAIGYPDGVTSTPIPASGPLSMHNFYGASGFPATLYTFTSSGTFNVPLTVTVVDVLIVAGGGGGGSTGSSSSDGAGGGGAGGVLYIQGMAVTPGAALPVIIGAGGAGVTATNGLNGSNSSFNGAIAIGGGGGGGGTTTPTLSGQYGGSGGGSCSRGSSKPAGVGTIGQGKDGGIGATNQAGGGGGGSNQVGFNGSNGTGGAGNTYTLLSTSVTVGGGGGGGSISNGKRLGGTGGGGDGGTTEIFELPPTFYPEPGDINTGGGGGATGNSFSGTMVSAAGGSGIVIILANPPPVPTGIVPSMSVFISNVSVTSGVRSASMYINSDGSITYTEPVAGNEEWFLPITSGIGSGFYAYATATGSGTWGGDSLSTWINLSTAAGWSLTSTSPTAEDTGTLTVDIAASAGGPVLGTMVATFNVGYIT